MHHGLDGDGLKAAFSGQRRTRQLKVQHSVRRSVAIGIIRISNWLFCDGVKREENGHLRAVAK
jgi:hypothetical protein